MITWEILDGDLQVGAKGFAALSGAAKVQQDLYVATAEPYGSDPFHPGWGCQLGNYIGSTVTDTTEALVTSEIARVVNNYMLVQQEVMQELANAGRANQYNTSEVISGVSAISVNQSTDVLSVDVNVTTQDGSTVPVSTSVNK